MLSEKEFERLQKLACIKLDSKEKKKLGDQLVNIIDFLDQLKNIKIDKNLISTLEYDNHLRLVSGIKKYENVIGLLKNVKHNQANNNIVIKSVLN